MGGEGAQQDGTEWARLPSHPGVRGEAQTTSLALPLTFCTISFGHVAQDSAQVTLALHEGLPDSQAWPRQPTSVLPPHTWGILSPCLTPPHPVSQRPEHVTLSPTGCEHSEGSVPCLALPVRGG